MHTKKTARGTLGELQLGSTILASMIFNAW
jgi:hypothetical protein